MSWETCTDWSFCRPRNRLIINPLQFALYRPTLIQIGNYRGNFAKNIMKKLLLLLSIFVLAAPLTKSTNDGGTVPIPVVDSHELDPIHRSLIPIEAYYISLNSSICVTFSQNLGDMDVTVTNMTTGDSDDFEIVASVGSTLLPISGDAGYFRIDFILASGTQYYGEFEII